MTFRILNRPQICPGDHTIHALEYAFFLDRAEFVLDPLSDVLSVLKPRSFFSAGLDAGGDWSLSFPAHEGIKFNAVLRGACWVSVDGYPETQRLEAGDCFLLTRGRPLYARHRSGPRSVDCRTIYDAAQDGIATCNGGGDFFLIGGRFAFAGDHAAMLFRALAPIVHVRESSSHASVLRWSLDQLALELRNRELGGGLVAEHLAHIMLVQALRLHLTSSATGGVGCSSPSPIRTSARQFARCTRSRPSVDTGRIRTAVRHVAHDLRSEVQGARGMTPMEYLTRWRMLIAGDRLRNSNENVASIALSLGYESESGLQHGLQKNDELFAETISASADPRRTRTESMTSSWCSSSPLRSACYVSRGSVRSTSGSRDGRIPPSRGWLCDESIQRICVLPRPIVEHVDRLDEAATERRDSVVNGWRYGCRRRAAQQGRSSPCRATSGSAFSWKCRAGRATARRCARSHPSACEGRAKSCSSICSRRFRARDAARSPRGIHVPVNQGPWWLPYGVYVPFGCLLEPNLRDVYMAPKLKESP